MFVSACSNINAVIDITSVRHPWLLQVPSEMHPLQTRASGQGINVFFNFLASFFIGQFFNTMLCTMQVSAPLQALSLHCTYALITCAHPSDLWHDAPHTDIFFAAQCSPHKPALRKRRVECPQYLFTPQAASLLSCSAARISCNCGRSTGLLVSVSCGLYEHCRASNPMKTSLSFVGVSAGLGVPVLCGLRSPGHVVRDHLPARDQGRAHGED